LSVQHSKELADWLADSGKNLTTIYITHAHDDHFLGLKLLLDRFPNARALATAPVVATMQNQIKPEFIHSFWEPRFPGQVPSKLALAEVLEGDSLYLEGEELKVIELGHTDTSPSTALHVSSIGLVVSGDAVYDNTHSYLVSAMQKPGASGSVRWIRSRRCIRRLGSRPWCGGTGQLSTSHRGNQEVSTRF
jgi:glyoxylase-like metal-dependent hydrolase (beta-lactamase superfamily II)